MIFAEAVSPTTTIQIGFAFTAVVSVVTLALQFRRKPPLEVDFVMKSEFNEFKGAVERRVGKLEEKMDTAFLRLGDKLDDMKGEIMASGERRGATIHERINQIEGQVARVDERTRRALSQ